MSTERHRVLRAAASLLLLCSALAACSSGSEPTAAPTTAGEPGLRGAPIVPPAPKPEFVLTDTDGARFDFAQETAGELTLLYFGYASCPDVCQLRMAQLARLVERPGLPPLKVVFVTVDPERDTPRVIRNWLDQFDETFVGLSGTVAEVDTAQEAAGLPPAKKLPGDTPDDYLMSHPSYLLSYAPDGLGYTQYSQSTTLDDYEHDMRILALRRA